MQTQLKPRRPATARPSDRGGSALSRRAPRIEIKAKFGGKVWSKKETGQVNEALLKVVCHNIVVLVQSLYEMGIAPVFWRKSMGALCQPWWYALRAQVRW